MATTISGITDATLQKLVDAIAASTVQPNGTILTSFKDRNETDIAPTVSEVIINVRINPDGKSAVAMVQPVGSKAEAIIGKIDNAVLATKLV